MNRTEVAKAGAKARWSNTPVPDALVKRIVSAAPRLNEAQKNELRRLLCVEGMERAA